MLAEQHGGGSKVAPPPHALALYQQQITMAHGESSQEGKQQQPLSGQLGKQQLYHPQADRDRDSPQIRSRSPSSSDKDGRKTGNTARVHPPMQLLVFVRGSEGAGGAGGGRFQRFSTSPSSSPSGCDSHRSSRFYNVMLHKGED